MPTFRQFPGLMIGAASLVALSACSGPGPAAGGSAVVAPTPIPVTAGKDAAANAKALSAALQQASTATASKPALILLPPGTYDLGKNGVVLSPYVTVMGSGDSTVLTATDSPLLVVVSHDAGLGFVTVDDKALTSGMGAAVRVTGGKLYHDTVKIDSTNGAVHMMYAVQAESSAALTDVTATATAGAGVGANNGQVAGVFVGPSDDAAGVTMRNVDATADGGDYISAGISFDQKAAATLNDVTANGPVKGGTYQQPFGVYCLIGCNVTMNDSVARAQYALFEGDTATHTNTITGARSIFLGMVSFKNLNCAAGSLAESDITYCY